MDLLVLQERFVEKLLVRIGLQWDQVHIHYEHYIHEGTVYEKYMADSFTGDEPNDFILYPELTEVLRQMRGVKPAGQVESWSWLEFSMKQDGSYKFEYKYGIPPMAAEALKYT